MSADSYADKNGTIRITISPYYYSDQKSFVSFAPRTLEVTGLKPYQGVNVEYDAGTDSYPQKKETE